MIRKITSGEVVELSGFKVGNATKPRSKKKKGGSTIRKQDENDRSAIRHLARTINSNFKQGDCWITLHYDEPRMDKLRKAVAKAGLELTPDTLRDAAAKEMDRCMRRIAREMKKDGLELRYVKSTADIDGDTGEYVRPHHHLVVPRDAYDYICRHWPQDQFDHKPLRDQKDYTAIAVYIINQVRRQPDRQKYTPSRNLKKPVIEEEIVIVRKQLKAPSGAKVMAAVYDDQKPAQYIRYIKPPKKVKRGGKRE